MRLVSSTVSSRAPWRRLRSPFMLALITVVGLLVTVSSCRKQSVKPVLEQLPGKWDSYKAAFQNNVIDGPAPWMLCCNEQGFELYSDGKYAPRYVKAGDPLQSMETSTDPQFKGFWTYNKDTITFININGTMINRYPFIVKAVSEEHLELHYPFANFPIFYLRRKP